MKSSLNQQDIKAMGNTMEPLAVLEVLSVKGRCTFTAVCISVVLGLHCCD